MAIYHLSASIVKRSAGRSVTAAAAYRAGSEIKDITTGLVHDYTHKKGVDYSVILSPINSSLGNEWLTNRQELWNKVEEAEKQKNAQLAREVTIAIPKELPRSEQIALVREYVTTNYVAAGVIADVNLHHLDGDNPHAHILLSMRNLQTSPEGIVKFGLKNRDWNSKELLLTQRKSWEEITNKYLAASGLDIKIDCRSLRDQGSEFIPQIHVGVHAMAMHRKGLQTDRKDEFDKIKAANNDIRARLEQIYEYESELDEEENNEIKERDHKLAESIIEAIKHNPYPRSENEAIKAEKRIARDHALFDSSHSVLSYSILLNSSALSYSVTLNRKQNIEVRIHGARSKLFRFEREDNRWIKRTFYHKTAFPVITDPNEFWKEHIDIAVQDFNQGTINDYYSKLKRVKLEDKKLQVKEYELGKVVINLSEQLQNKRLHIEPIIILVEKNMISIYSQGSSPYASPLELINDGHNNFSRAYIRHDMDEASKIDYLTEIVTNYQNELTSKLKIESVEVVIVDEDHIVFTPNFFEKIDPNNKPPILSPISDGNVVNHIRKTLTIALEKEPKPTAVQTSTVVPILTPPDPQSTQSTETIAITPNLPIIKLDPIDSDLELVTPLPDRKIIKQQAKRKPNRGFER